ncbi:MAG: hypothetical protein MK384_09230 [SAR202 cluster bacterium]|nr:hypothetical protein [SAR202 cluster bacterium]
MLMGKVLIHRYLHHSLVIPLTALLVFVITGCGAKEDPFAVGDREEFRHPTQTVPTATTSENKPNLGTPGQTSTQQSDETADQASKGPSKEELVKLANWDDKTVNLSNFIAGYIIAHGLDHPVRLIDVGTSDYGEALLIKDVDIVLQANPNSYKGTETSQSIIVLDPLSEQDASTNIVVHKRIEGYAPEVIEFLENYSLNETVITELSARITTGRMGLKANVVGLIFFKNNEALWNQWISQSVAERVSAAIDSGKTGMCRKFVETQMGGSKQRTCPDDPNITLDRS